MAHKTHIAVLGAGAWGTALANLAARNAAKVHLWARDPSHAVEMAATGVNARRLPGVPLPANLVPTAALADVADAEAIFLAVPAQAVRQTCLALAGMIGADVPLVICAKGIERTSGLFLSEVIGEVLPENPPAVLSGPSFAEDVAQRPADGGDARGAERRRGRRARAHARCALVPALPFARHSRRRNRRRGEERARHRQRHRRRARARRQRRGGADRARLCRTVALRPRLWRRSRDPRGPLRPRRSGAHLHFGPIAQFLLRLRAGARQGDRRRAGGRASSPRASSPPACSSISRIEKQSTCRSAKPSMPCSPSGSASTRRSRRCWRDRQNRNWRRRFPTKSDPKWRIGCSRANPRPGPGNSRSKPAPKAPIGTACATTAPSSI